MAQSSAQKLKFRVAELRHNRPTELSFSPDAQQRKKIADALGLDQLRKLSFVGTLKGSGKSDWQLSGRLGATVVQPCGITLQPVTTRIEDVVERHYLADWQPSDAVEAEMDEDVTTEPLEAEIDIYSAILEGLSLAVPAFPRAEGAEIGQVLAAPPGAESLTDEKVKPFAGLAELKKKMEQGDS